MDNELQKINNPIEEERQEIVEYLEEAGKETNVEQVISHPIEYAETGMDTLEHTVVDFLNRPIELQNFVWETTQAEGQELGTRVLLPESWLGVQMIRDKLQGFQYLKTGFKVRIQVNAMPFHQGRLLVIYEPLFQQTKYIPSSVQHFGGATGYHRVDLDLSENTSVELHVPFLSNIPYFDLVRAIGNLGTVRVFVYSQLRGPENVEGTIWIEACDTEVQMATGVDIWPRQKVKAQGKFVDSMKKVGSRYGEDVAGNGMNNTGGGMKIEQNISEKEAKAKSMGIVERVAGAAKGACDALVDVPIIGSFAKAGSWISGAAASVASLFGWSKPLDEASSCKFVQSYAADMGNFNGSSKAKVLALDRGNRAIIPREAFGTDEDEMALSYVLSRPVYMARFTVNTLAKPNQIVWAWPVSPASCYKTKVTESKIKFKNNTYLSYLSEMFYCWRGGINYHFKFVKTRFHSVRLRVFFCPGVFEDTNVAILDANKMYSQVVDIRDSTSFDFTVPFVYHQPWASLREMPAYKDDISETIPIGMIYVEVLNALRVGGNADPTMEVLVETSAADDFQFGYHDVHSNYSPLLKATEQGFYASKLTNTTTTVRELGTYKNVTLPVLDQGRALTGQALADKLENAWRTQRASSLLRPSGKIEVPKVDVSPQNPPPPIRPVAKIEKPIENPVEKVEVKCELPLWDDAKGLPEITFVAQDLDKTDVLVPDYYFSPEMRKLIWNKIFDTQIKDSKVSGIIANILYNKFNLRYPEKPRDCVPAQSFFPRKETNTLGANIYGLGEAVVSFRQILKRYSPQAKTTVPAANQSAEYLPYVSAGAYYTTEGVPFTRANNVIDRVASLYRWQAGSMRIALSQPIGTKRPSGTVSLVHARPGFQNFETGVTNRIKTHASARLLENKGFTYAYPSTEKFVEFQVPFYQRGPAIPTSLGAPENSDLDQGIFGNDYVPSNLGTSVLIQTQEDLSIWQAIGEDFSYGYLIGVPLTATSTE